MLPVSKPKQPTGLGPVPPARHRGHSAVCRPAPLPGLSGEGAKQTSTLPRDVQQYDGQPRHPLLCLCIKPMPRSPRAKESVHQAQVTREVSCPRPAWRQLWRGPTSDPAPLARAHCGAAVGGAPGEGAAPGSSPAMLPRKARVAGQQSTFGGFSFILFSKESVFSYHI